MNSFHLTFLVGAFLFVARLTSCATDGADSSTASSSSTTAKSPSKPDSVLTLVHGSGLAVEQPNVVLAGSGAGETTASFMVFCDTPKTPMTNLAVAVCAIRQPDGSKLDVEDFRDVLGKPEITNAQTLTEAGSRVVFHPVHGTFTKPGSYVVTLRVQADDQAKTPQVLFTLLTLTVPFASIDADAWKDVLIPEVRRWPFGLGAEPIKVKLSLRESGRRLSLEKIKLDGGLVYQEVTLDKAVGKHLVPKASVEPLPESPRDVPPGGALDFELNVKGIEGVGTFDTWVTIRSDSLATESVTVPLRLQVTDCALWPLLAVALGVALSAFANYIAQQRQPRLQNRRLLLDIKSDLDRFQRTALGESAATLEGIERQRVAAGFSNDIGDFAAVQTALASLNKDLNEFRVAKAQAKDAARHAEATWRTKVRFYKTLTDPAELAPLTTSLNEIDDLLTADQVDAAQAALIRLSDIATDSFNGILVKSATDIRNVITTRYAQKYPEFQTQLDAVNDAIAKQDLDGAREALSLLALEISEADQQQSGGGGVSASQVRHTVSRAKPGRLHILPKPRQPTTDMEVQLTLEPVGAITDGEIHWDFGDHTDWTGGCKVSHRFNEARDYEIVATVSRAAQADEQHVYHLKIKPGRMEAELATMRRQLRNGAIVTWVISLIIATLSGFFVFFSDKAFGTWTDYVAALLWGLGLDNGVRGFASVLQNVSKPAAHV